MVNAVVNGCQVRYTFPRNELDTTLAALADPTRRRVIDLLREGPRRAGELAATAETSAPAMSRHLRLLRASGLVEAEGVDDDARLRLYKLRPERFVALQAWLDQVEAFWGEQLGAFKAHVERTRKGKRR
jgi:DNA-binding transcriptional ArsR family regulator